jgi:hypothetical protein
MLPMDSVTMASQVLCYLLHVEIHKHAVPLNTTTMLHEMKGHFADEFSQLKH